MTGLAQPSEAAQAAAGREVALTAAELAAIDEVRLAGNVRRALPALALVLPVFLAAGVYFAQAHADPGSAQERWHALLATAHEVLSLVLAVLLLAAWRAGRAPVPRWRAAVPLAIALAGTQAGAVVAGIDQLVTPALTPYVIASFGVALLVRLPTWQAAAVQLAALVVFARLAVLLQASEVGRVSAVLNAITASAVAVAVSTALTRAADGAERARVLISRQGRELAELRGLLKVCAYCGRIHDEVRGWEKLESYVARHSGAEFSHGMCEDCFRREMAKVEG